MSSSKKIILDLCGGTGAWSQFYRESKDYEVIIVDPYGDEQENATLVKEDIRLFVAPQKVHGVVAAPPCTHLSGSGARWWAEKGEEALRDSLSIVDACIRVVYKTDPVWWALENPVGRLTTYLGKPKLIFNPYDYGTPTKKRTCLWGNFTKPIKDPIEPYLGQVVWFMGPSKDRAKKRSITPAGFAYRFFESNR